MKALAGAIGAGGFPVVGAGFIAPQDDKSLKTMTELFVGNMPPGASGPPLQEFLNAAMIETKLNTAPGNPITDVRHNTGSKFAFLVFRNTEECTKALNMTGIPYMNCMLKIERPSTFVGPKTGVSSDFCPIEITFS